MKKTNKKGFTLAELLIVVAIIAILIAIAIPAFGGALDNAKLQTDHANIRSAYAIAQAATLQGGIFVGDDPAMTPSSPTANASYVFTVEGKIALATDTTAVPYKCKVDGSADKCASSIGCKDSSGTVTHGVGDTITINYAFATGKYTVVVG